MAELQGVSGNCNNSNNYFLKVCFVADNNAYVYIPASCMKLNILCVLLTSSVLERISLELSVLYVE